MALAIKQWQSGNPSSNVHVILYLFYSMFDLEWFIEGDVGINSAVAQSPGLSTTTELIAIKFSADMFGLQRPVVH